MRMQVILDSLFARSGSVPIGGGKKGEFRDWTKFSCVHATRKPVSGSALSFPLICDKLCSTFCLFEDSSPCAVSNGGCSQFCVATKSGSECVCPTGLAVKQDNKTCEDSKSTLKSGSIASYEVEYS